MVNEEETQVKGEMEEPVDAESDVGEEVTDDPVDEDDVADSSRMSEALFQADQLYLRSLLPQEIWYMTMDMLKDSPEDLINCINASPYFWELQRDERVIFLFPGVLDILVKLYEPRGWFKVVDTEVEQPKAADVEEGQEKMDEENGAKEDDDEIDEDVREELAEEDGQAEDSDGEDDVDNEDETRDPPGAREENNKNWISAVLNCRLVCSSWNETIENCYGRPDMSGISDFHTDPDPRSAVNLFGYRWIKRNSHISGKRTAEKFMEHFSQSHHSGEKAFPKNPVPGRYMSFETAMDATDAERTFETLNTVSKLLKMFGKGLWYTRINIPCWFLTEVQYYLKVREWLCLMPNLKYLELEQVWSTGTVSQDVLADNPMPKLENIQVIDINYKCGGTIINEVVRMNSHVPHLKFRESNFDERIGALLSNLSAFSTNNLHSFDVKMMEKYGPSWKLCKANVHNFHGDFKGMFQLVEKNWANTLTDLELSFSLSRGTGILDGSKDLRLNLPYLRRLHLYVEDFMLLDFILPLANTLEYLEIKTWDPINAWRGRRDARDAKGKDQTIQYAGFEKRMHQSNIWQIFKRLKTIKVEWIGKWGTFAVYTREGNKLFYRHITSANIN